MKKYLLFLMVPLTVLLYSVTLFSQPVPKRSIQLNENQISENLLIGMQSGNKGLCASSTYLIGELCCKKGVIPLLSLLHNAKCEEIRILAALSLVKLGDARGIFAVKRAAIYDDSERVRRLCNLFYKASLAGDEYLTPELKKG
jgi:hypothetical protein